MKIVQFKAGKYHFVREAGNLEPLTETSLASQLKFWREEVCLTDPPRFLVLSHEEEQVVICAINSLAGNTVNEDVSEQINGLGRRLLEQLAREVGWESVFIPADGNATAPIFEIKSWSMAFRPIA